jgi:transposase
LGVGERFFGLPISWDSRALSSSYRRGGASSMCKENDAENVKRMMPQTRSGMQIVPPFIASFTFLHALTGRHDRHNYSNILNATSTRFGVPPSRESKPSKLDALAEDGALNPAAEKVRDPKFQEDGFFDPRDIVQVKYEMLRRASVEKASVTDVSEEYGVSRPTFYQAKTDFEQSGVAGLLPKKRGPRGPHKVQGEALAFLKAQISPGEPIRARELAKSLLMELGVEVHPRTIERAIGGKKTTK